MSPIDFWAALKIIGEQYPQFLPILKEPGVWDVLFAAAQAPREWSPERIQAALTNTPFFKNTTAAQRQWYILDIVDPATTTQQKHDAELKINVLSQQLGINPSGYDRAIIALNAAVNQWDETRIKMELVAKANGGTSGPGGIGDQMTQYQGLAAQYGVPVNHNDLYWWASNTATGSVSQEGFRDFVTQQAINLYPALTPFLQTGQTVQQYTTPYFQMAANELGINPNQISLLNPKWTEVFLGRNDAGQQTVLSMQDSLRKIRQDPSYGFDSGTPGITQAATFATQLETMFGASG